MRKGLYGEAHAWGQPVRKLRRGNPRPLSPLSPLSVPSPLPLASLHPFLLLCSAAMITYIFFQLDFSWHWSFMNIWWYSFPFHHCSWLFSLVNFQRDEYSKERVSKKLWTPYLRAGCWLSDGISTQRQSKHLSQPRWAPYYLLGVGHISVEISKFGVFISKNDYSYIHIYIVHIQDCSHQRIEPHELVAGLLTTY